MKSPGDRMDTSAPPAPEVSGAAGPTMGDGHRAGRSVLFVANTPAHLMGLPASLARFLSARGVVCEALYGVGSMLERDPLGAPFGETALANKGFAKLHRTVWMPTGSTFSDMKAAVGAVAQLLQAGDYDAVWTSDPYSSWAARRAVGTHTARSGARSRTDARARDAAVPAAPSAAIRLVHTIRELASRTGRAPSRSLKARLAEATVRTKAHAIVATTPEDYSAAARFYGAGRTWFIEGCCITTDPPPLSHERRSELRSACGSDSADTLIVVPGVHDDLSVPGAVLDLAQALPDDARFAFVGGGAATAELQKTIVARGLTHKAAIVGAWDPQAELDLYQAADIGLIAPSQPGYLFDLQQMMACGLPCVGVKEPGVEHVIGDERFVAGEVAGLQRAVSELVSDLGDRTLLGACARQRATAFGAETIGPKYEQLFFGV